MTGSPARPRRLLAPLAVITINLLAVGCTPPAAPTSNAPVAANSSGNTTTAAATPEQTPASFINKVWRVRESSAVAPGTLYVFLSEGSLVMASPNGKPSLGAWKREGEAFTMIEEGVAYKTDVLNLSENEFKIRSNNPGKPVEITLIPAEGSFPTP